VAKNDKARAREALAIAQASPVLKATWTHLYKRCLDGIADLNRLRQLVKPVEANSDDPHCRNSDGKKIAESFENRSIDNVLTVLLGETKPGEWRWDIIMDNTLSFGSPVNLPCKRREEAEKAVVASLSTFGLKAKPSQDLYHVTTPEVAEIILRDGFKDHATTVRPGGFFGFTKTYKPGVWFADMPPISVVGDDGGYFGNVGRDEAWIRVKVTPQDFDGYFADNEILDDTWGTRQWLIKASKANKLPREEMSLRDALAYRLLNLGPYDEDLPVRPDFVRKMIEAEMTDATIKARWLDALDAASSAP
jgi:hypothetical protein